MTTAQDIVNGALKKIGVLRKNESPSADESVDALNVLNDIMASWSNDSLLCYATVTDTLSISPASSYSIGTGQTLNTTRPMWIKAATVTSSGIDYELTIVPETDFQVQIAQKSISSSIPQYLTYNNAYPTGTIKMWPVPSTSLTLTLMSEKLIGTFSALTTTFDMPPGWSHALKLNLATHLYSDYNLPPDPLVIQHGKDAKGALKKQTIKAHPITFDGDMLRKYSIYTGTEV